MAASWIGRLARSAGVVFTRGFWTARTLNAVLGAALTIGAGVASVGIGDGLRKEIGDIDEQIRATAGRIDTIERAMFEFQLFESTGTLIQVLSLNQSIPADVQASFRHLMYIDRRHAYLVILSELFPKVEAWQARKAEYDDATEGARAGDRGKADQVILMERDDTIAARALQAKLIEQRFALVVRKDAVQQRLNRLTMLGFTLQQIGFVLVLFAGLVSQHLADKPRLARPEGVAEARDGGGAHGPAVPPG